MRQDDWMLAQLPVGMIQEDFFYRFVSLFQELSGGLVDGADNIANILDVTVAPDALVRYLGSWIGIQAVDASLPVEVQRRIVRTCARVLAWRGTCRGLREFVELMSGEPAELLESGGVYNEGDAPGYPPAVRITVTSTGVLPEDDFAALVRDEVPADVFLELYVGERRIVPPLPLGAAA